MINSFTFLPDIKSYLGNPYWRMLHESLLQAGLTYVDVASSKTPYFGRRWLLENRGKVDVIHLHFVQQFYAYKATHARLRWVLRYAFYLLYARALGYRVVFTAHDLTATLPLKPDWVDYLGHWAAVNLSNCVLVHCASSRAAITKLYGRRHGIELITHPNFIGIYPDTTSSPVARSVYQLDSDKRVFLFFGGVRPNKGIELLVKTFRQLPGDHLRLIIAGKPQPGLDYDKVIRELASSDPRIFLMLRYIPDEEIQYLMRAADIVVLPFSRILASGSVMLALSFGKPVIVPDMGCLHELVSADMGFRYPPNDEQTLKQALAVCAVLPADQLLAMGQRAKQTVELSTVEQLAQETIAAYRDV